MFSEKKCNDYLFTYYGEKKIIKKAVEELIEFAIALITNDRDSIIEEMADVINMFNKLNIDMPFTNKSSYHNKPLKFCLNAIVNLLIKKNNKLDFNVFVLIEYVRLQNSISFDLVDSIRVIKLKRAVKRTFNEKDLTAKEVKKYYEILEDDSSSN